ncbi:alpha/beta hydrolase [uncultured Roseobacter sp.]|uniref:alpha/beta fold hydrolase n=1 Tax=uncultured Roseobacter sp. TaxID=114847 RepID=UPI00262B9C7C|nr:alpha/beta hydrolase [uncultured Roseobacter sp.]
MTQTILPLSESGLRVSLREAGAGDTILLIHGVGLQSAAWQPQIDALRRRYRVIAVDMPGHGGSDALPKGSDLPGFVDWCRQVVRQTRSGPVSIVGHSMGALIAAGFAVQFPDMTRRVALLNGVFRRGAEARDAVTARADRIAAGDIDVDTPLQRWFGASPSEIAARERVAGWLSDVNPRGYATAYSAFARGDATYADRFGSISCPFLAMTGDMDPNSTPAMSRQMANIVAKGEVCVIRGHRHMINLTAPDAVNAHLTDWLDRTAETEAAV